MIKRGRSSFWNIELRPLFLPTGHQSSAGPQEFQHDDEVPACATTASGQRAIARRLASGEAASRLGTAVEPQSPATSAAEPRFPVIDILRQHLGEYVRSGASGMCPHVGSTLAKISVCRTAALGASWHWCGQCDSGVRIANSCGDRHCPQCRGAQRATWVDGMQPLLLEGVPHFQVVFTMPDDLSSLALGNRRNMFHLLFRSAWESLKHVVEDEQQFEAAAAIVLHTWNQKLDAHVHVHAVVPGGGPSLVKAGRWKPAEPPPHERPDRLWLCDADNLRRKFRERFLAGLRRLHRRGELQLDGDREHLRDEDAFNAFLAPLEQKSWVTYIEAPPNAASQPADVVKYLARYLTGGPISDWRITEYNGRDVTFTARTGDTHGGSDETEEVSLPVVQFVRRWCLHILPSGFSRSRRVGGWSPRHRKRYVAECRRIRQADSGQSPPTEVADDNSNELADAASPSRSCPSCGGPLERLDLVFRTSWRDIFSSDACPAWYRKVASG